MFGVRAALAAAMMLGLSACEDDRAAGDGAATDDEREASMNCRRDLPPPSVAGDVSGDLSLVVEDFSYEVVDGRHRYNHTRRFRETGGVPVTIYRGKVCVDDGAECVDACVSYRVPAGTTFVQADHHVATKRESDRITLRYWARDDAGNLFELDRVIETDGRTARVID
ncbi:MAG: hypothetical protein RIB45_03710 [Marivibrio sp.]|uniref:hypothetical protein n=1 Tax=Marivibrio sp. TaxID=2039719 RepID=UPI0032EFB3C3